MGRRGRGNDRSPPLFSRALRRAARAPISRPDKPPTGATAPVTTFDDRERAYEAKFAHDEEMKFRVIARRNKLLGHWAATQMKLSAVEAEAYAKEVVRAEFEDGGDEDVVRKLLGDLTAAGVETDDSAIRAAMEEQTVIARRQLIEAQD